MSSPAAFSPWTIDFTPRASLAPEAGPAPRAEDRSREPDFFVVLQDQIEGQRPVRSDDAEAPRGSESLRGSDREGQSTAPVSTRRPELGDRLVGSTPDPARADVPIQLDPEQVAGPPSPPASDLIGSISEGLGPVLPVVTDDRVTPPTPVVPTPPVATPPTGLTSTEGTTALPPNSLPVVGTGASSALHSSVGDGLAMTMVDPKAGAGTELIGSVDDGLGLTAVEGATPVTDVEALRQAPDLDDLDPEMRQRLERVLSRMRSEYGHNVTLVEAYRSQERQAALYAQGRTAPGPIVTWTQDSKHTQGLAVDVMIDGSWAPHEGYQRLNRIAAEEGLKTLWPNDPGHIEMDPSATPLTGTDSGNGLARIAELAPLATPARPAPASEPAPVALTATVSQPAPTATVADPAMPATVPGGIPALPEPRATDAERLALTSTDTGANSTESPTALFAASGGSSNGPDSQSTFADGEGPQRDRIKALADAAVRRAERSGVEPFGDALRGTDVRGEAGSLSATLVDSASTALGDTTLRVQGPTTAESLHRVTQVREMQELAYPRRLGQMTLRMMDGLGEEARMRVSLAGRDVNASIGVRDLGLADGMRSRLGSLERALRARGLDNVAVRVSALATGAPSEAGSLTGAAVTAGRGGQSAENEGAWTGHRDRSQDGRAFDEQNTADDRRRQPQQHSPGQGQQR